MKPTGGIKRPGVALWNCFAEKYNKRRVNVCPNEHYSVRGIHVYVILNGCGNIFSKIFLFSCRFGCQTFITKTIFLSCIWYNFIIITTTQLTKNVSNNIVLIQVFSNAATDKEKSNYTSTKRTTARRRIDDTNEKIENKDRQFLLLINCTRNENYTAFFFPSQKQLVERHHYSESSRR